MASGKPDDVLQPPARGAILVGIRWQSLHFDDTMTLSYLDRQVTQPGPAAAERIDSIASTAVPLSFTLEPGLTLREAIAAPLLAAGIVSASVRLETYNLHHFITCVRRCRRRPTMPRTTATNSASRRCA